MARFEADPEKAALMTEARSNFARAVFKDGVATLRSLRLSRGLSQEQLAAKLKTAQSHISLIEMGKNDPGTDTIVSLAEVLGVQPEVVFATVRAQRVRRQKT